VCINPSDYSGSIDQESMCYKLKAAWLIAYFDIKKVSKI
jgi:hypothetical protein